MSEKPKGPRPDIRLGVKNKSTGERVYWASGWRGDRGINLSLDKRATLLIDGKPVTFGREGTHYFDMFEGEYKPQGAKYVPDPDPNNGAEIGGFDGDDIPF